MVVCIMHKGDAYEILVGDVREKHHLGYLDEDGRKILKRISKINEACGCILCSGGSEHGPVADCCEYSLWFHNRWAVS
jgi:hypothetical protein